MNRQAWVNNNHSILSASSILAELKPLGSDGYQGSNRGSPPGFGYRGSTGALRFR